mmetsp:Transcript_2621/g.2214  ORF Transcript_2621/g.2214 Transcript_2621/m.2214 type:complete len:139 (+) Transcript_2621:1167-1583(+)
MIKSWKLKEFFTEKTKLFEIFNLLSSKCIKNFSHQLNGYQNLVLNGCFITWCQLDCLYSNRKDENLTETLKEISKNMLNHLRECSQCNYHQKQCSICLSGEDNIQEYDIDQVERCPNCHIIGHKECIKDHLKNYIFKT